MANLSSLDAVNRILGYVTGDDPARDAKLRASLAAVESWADGALWKISDEGPQVEVYFDVKDDATLYLPAQDITVTKVKIIPRAAGDDSFFWIYMNASSGTGQGYDLDDQGRLFLRPMRVYSTGIEGAFADSLGTTYDRVEVHYIGTGVIPVAVSEGIAFLTAGYYRYGKKILEGMKSEKIGDYSYTLATGPNESALPYMDQARMFLGRFMRKQRVRVI